MSYKCRKYMFWLRNITNKPVDMIIY